MTHPDPNPNPQEQTLLNRSRAYHAHPSHAEDCETHQEFYGGRCPCESYRPVKKEEGK